jgi:hypothetical protein
MGWKEQARPRRPPLDFAPAAISSSCMLITANCSTPGCLARRRAALRELAEEGRLRNGTFEDHDAANSLDRLDVDVGPAGARV